MAVSRYFNDQVLGMPSRPNRTAFLCSRKSLGALVATLAIVKPCMVKVSQSYSLYRRCGC